METNFNEFEDSTTKYTYGGVDFTCNVTIEQNAEIKSTVDFVCHQDEMRAVLRRFMNVLNHNVNNRVVQVSILTYQNVDGFNDLFLTTYLVRILRNGEDVNDLSKPKTISVDRYGEYRVLERNGRIKRFDTFN